MSRSEEQKNWKALVELFSEVHDPDRMASLLEFFLTLNEKSFLIDRYRLVRELFQAKKSQREIAEELKISISKITAGSNAIKRCPDELKEFLTGYFNS
ncbi:MAG: trp operon repressor [Waddliaceae bacterium]|nr:trp operon repressor [Waddliaceae bacterium]